jgi:hypothetical protein
MNSEYYLETLFGDYAIQDCSRLDERCTRLVESIA